MSDRYVTTDPSPVLTPGAIYWSDNGCRICSRCAGAGALYAGHDISGQRVERVTLDDVREWPEEFGPLACETGCTTLSTIAGPDGWPMARPHGRDPCLCGCRGDGQLHDERSHGPWPCPVCDEDSDADEGLPCTACERGGAR